MFKCWFPSPLLLPLYPLPSSVLLGSVFLFILNSLSSVSNKFPSGKVKVDSPMVHKLKSRRVFLSPSQCREDPGLCGWLSHGCFPPCSAPGPTVLSVSHGVDSSSKNYKEGWRLGTQQMQKELRPENKPWRR